MKITITEIKKIIKEEMGHVLENMDMNAAAEIDSRIDQGQDDAQDIALDAMNQIEDVAKKAGLEPNDVIQMVVAHLAGQQ